MQIKNVQIFTLEWIENAIAESIGAMITLFGTETVRIVRMPNEYLTHHGYSMLLKDEKFWWACDGEWVLIFQVRAAAIRWCLTTSGGLDPLPRIRRALRRVHAVRLYRRSVPSRRMSEWT